MDESLAQWFYSLVSYLIITKIIINKINDFRLIFLTFHKIMGIFINRIYYNRYNIKHSKLFKWINYLLNYYAPISLI